MKYAQIKTNDQGGQQKEQARSDSCLLRGGRGERGSAAPCMRSIVLRHCIPSGAVPGVSVPCVPCRSAGWRPAKARESGAAVRTPGPASPRGPARVLQRAAMAGRLANAARPASIAVFGPVLARFALGLLACFVWPGCLHQKFSLPLSLFFQLFFLLLLF